MIIQGMTIQDFEFISRLALVIFVIATGFLMTLKDTHWELIIFWVAIGMFYVLMPFWYY